METIQSDVDIIEIPLGKVVKIISVILPDKLDLERYDIHVECKVSERSGYTKCIPLVDRETEKGPGKNIVYLNEVIYDAKSTLKNFKILLGYHDEVGSFPADIKAVYKFVDIPKN